MNPLRKSLCVTAGAVALACLPLSAAVAHDGDHPFENCTAAYEAGYSNIEKGDQHYGKHLDRDGDGLGCDRPPSGFVPADDMDEDEAEGGDEGSAAESGAEKDPALAETGGDATTSYVAGGGLVVLLAGAGVVAATRRRHTSR